MIDETLWAEIRRLHHVEHLSHSAIAARLGLNRRTIAGALGRVGAPRYKRPSRGSIVAPFVDTLRARLRDHPDLSAARLLEELRKAGYRGGYSALKEALRELRPREVEAFIRRETEPGQEAQVDWGSFGSLRIGKALRPLSCFVMVLGYSRMLALSFTTSQRMEDFLRCHIDAFDFFGGVPHRILYDNLRSVVLARSGSTVRFHPRFTEFAGAHLFEPRPCGVRRANEKGKVESAIKYIRQNFFVGRDFRDLADLNRQAKAWRDGTANARLHGTTRERPIDRWARDKQELLAMPKHRFDTDVIVPLRASKMCLVHFDGNAYTVPFTAAHQALILRATPTHVRLLDKDTCVAEHLRSYDRGHVEEKSDHLRNLFDRKRAASAVRARDVLLGLCAEARAFLDGLLAHGRRLDDQLDKLMELVGEHGRTEVAQAVATAVEQRLFSAGYVEELLLAKKQLPAPSATVSVPTRPEVERTLVLPHSLEVYDDDSSQEPSA